MRGCSFADDFITMARIAANGGTSGGTGNSADHGLVTDGNGWIEYDLIPQPGGFAVVYRFSKTVAAGLNQSLIGNASVSSTTDTGFEIWLDADGVKANHSDGVTMPSACEVDFDYADGVTHTLMYVVDMTGGKHRLYVDALDVNEQSTTISTQIGDNNDLLIAYNFVGTSYNARIFDAVLTETEHDVYHAGTLKTSFWAPWASWRCNDFNDDTPGARIWDRTIAMRDLYKADRATATKYPTFTTDALGQEYYYFDGVDDYITGLANLLAALTSYTLTAATSSAASPYPQVQQHNDNTLAADLETEGGYTGYLHGMVLHNGVLTQMGLYFDEYQHLYWLWRGRAFGAYHRLITEGVCQLAVFFDYAADYLQDFSRNLYSPSITGLSQNGRDGTIWQTAGSKCRYNDTTVLRFKTGSIALYFKKSAFAVGTLVDKGLAYKLKILDVAGDLALDFNGSQALLTTVNMVTNGSFDTDKSGWTDQSTGEGGATGYTQWSSGKVRFRFSYA
jgi:hypothetical protein